MASISGDSPLTMRPSRDAGSKPQLLFTATRDTCPTCTSPGDGLPDPSRLPTREVYGQQAFQPRNVELVQYSLVVWGGVYIPDARFSCSSESSTRPAGFGMLPPAA